MRQYYKYINIDKRIIVSANVVYARAFERCRREKTGRNLVI